MNEGKEASAAALREMKILLESRVGFCPLPTAFRLQIIVANQN